jgi:putative phosphoribosyl transferase
VNRFANRAEAGRVLAERLDRFANRPDVIVLGLPMGGVPVAVEVARALRTELDVILVRRLDAPGRQGLAMGAVASGGVQLLHHALIDDLGLSMAAVRQMAMRERLKLDRQIRMLRGDRAPAQVGHRVAIVVDDGIATGVTMRTAIAALTRVGASAVVVAAPVGAPGVCARLGALATEVVCPLQPEAFDTIAAWYDDFAQTSDVDVIRLLAEASAPEAAPSAPRAPRARTSRAARARR